MNDIVLEFGSFKYSLLKGTVGTSTEQSFIVKSIENLSFASAELATTTSPYVDGDTVQNSVGIPRDITITIKPLKNAGNFDRIIHDFARMYRRSVKLIWKNKTVPSYTNDFPLEGDWIINGIVSEVECSRFDSDVELSVNVHCSYPYWTLKTITNDVKAVHPPVQGLSNEFYVYTDAPAPMELVFYNYNGGYGKYELEINYFQPGSIITDTQTLTIAPTNASHVGELHIDFTSRRMKATLIDGNQTETDVTSLIVWDFSLTSMGMQNTQFSQPRIYPLQTYSKASIIGYYYNNGGEKLGNTPVGITYYPAFI